MQGALLALNDLGFAEVSMSPQRNKHHLNGPSKRKQLPRNSCCCVLLVVFLLLFIVISAVLELTWVVSESPLWEICDLCLLRH